MERLEIKRINGHRYYYLSRWEWTDGKCRRTWQKYLGKLEQFSPILRGQPPAPLRADVYEFGLPMALWQEALHVRLAECIDAFCPKRTQGLSTGLYLSLAALNRAINPVSKMAMWDWLQQTSLARRLPGTGAAALNSQRFWDHMDGLAEATLRSCWEKLLRQVLVQEKVDLGGVCYDGTNFYTFIDTFNTDCTLAQRGKNKQGRANLRQVSYALFCSAKDHLPLYYEVYPGNRPDAVEFPQVLRRFEQWLQQLGQPPATATQTVLVFDKGNNSLANFTLLDELHVSFVGSLRLDEHKDLAQVPNADPRFTACRGERLAQTKAFKVCREVYGRERTVVVTYHESLFEAQWATVQADLTKAASKLQALAHRLNERAAGRIKGGPAPTVESVRQHCATILHRPHLDRLLVCAVEAEPGAAIRLTYHVDPLAVANLQQTLLGKTLLVTDQQSWSCEQIIEAYRSQFVIEDIFKGMKDRGVGSWWPLFHWTDQKIQVHGFYCTVAVLLRSLLWRRVRQGGVELSLKKLLQVLHEIREVVNVYAPAGGNGAERSQPVLTTRSELQESLMKILNLSLAAAPPINPRRANAASS
ncbi:MAG: IS1634 family transposase [Verrucomicrobia bacterium]|nr:IS1634 family transposase [Verrucomicrobiota bacterium]